MLIGRINELFEKGSENLNISPRISPLHLYIICFNATFGSSLATLPRSAGNIAHEDMWLSVIVGGMTFLFGVWAVTKLSSYYSEYTCIEYHQILLGPFFGGVINIILIALIIMVPATSSRTFIVALNIFLLDRTPPEYLTLIQLALFVYTTQYGLLPLIRTQQLIFQSNHLIFILLVLLGLMAINSTTHYRPFLAQGLTPVIKGAIPTFFAYTGPEIAISLLYPFITQQKKVFKWAGAAVITLIAVYTLITAIVQGILSPKEAAHQLIPTVIAFRNVEIPDTFIERLDAYFIIFWIPIYICCMINWVYFAAFAIERVLKLENSRSVVALLVPIYFYLITLAPDFQTAGEISEWVNLAYIIWDLGIWPFLLCIAVWKEKRNHAC
jgi:spore germination protein (amino acid permease)